MSKKTMAIWSWMLWCLCWSISGKSQAAESNHPIITQMDKGKHRFLLVFSPDNQNEFLLAQDKMLRQARLGLSERDLLVVQVVNNDVEVNPPVKEEFPSATSLRQTYKVNPEQFTVILVGKDGTEKYRAAHAQAPAVLFGIIDAMPMRQNEAHEKNNK
ncbi:DUF4174 domain-containing protein [Adhaeribacter radiodurans]|uniref:DUF4174 domain-containing protein n=1 Tax=Adhaeribacter radiodurans TaxID=2745197 RepID=A0A7L7LDU6_9BACT|nr:DUF4174 domain-containing protein [Adhaeribacter radiodurans]QMU30589.1 DUF4174 domain-containing protein [Adhaeribacter radiodurans]